MIQRLRMPLEERLHRTVAQAASLDELEALCLESVLVLLEDPRIARIYAVMLLKCEYTEDLAPLIEREAESRRHILDELTQFFQCMKQQRRIAGDRDPATLALALHMDMTGMFTEILRTPSCCRDRAAAQTLVGCFFQPLRSP